MKIRLQNSSFTTARIISHFRDRIRVAPHFSWRSALMLPVLAGIWALFVYLRKTVITLHCIPQGTPQALGTSQQLCSTQELWEIDRWVVPLSSPEADGFSYLTQNWTGAAAFFAPFVIAGVQLALEKKVLQALWQSLRDLGLLLFTVFLNGVFNEFARITVQRPRPFVYTNALYFGAEAGNYTSFYSGHTSFTAAASMGVLCLAAGRGAPRSMLILLWLWSFTVTIATGSFRVLSARHFTTDVIVGGLAGFCVAIAVALSHKSRSETHSRPQLK